MKEVVYSGNLFWGELSTRLGLKTPQNSIDFTGPGGAQPPFPPEYESEQCHAKL